MTDSEKKLLTALAMMVAQHLYEYDARWSDDVCCWR
jgi:hypothetical protein